jgi:hypothetical protein
MLIKETRFDGMRTYITVSPEGNKWLYKLELTTFCTSTTDQPDTTHLFRDLNFIQNSIEINEMTYLEYCNRVKPIPEFFLAHPWLAVFLPASVAADYVDEILTKLPLEESSQDLFLLHSFKGNLLHTPLFRVPKTETFFLFSLLRKCALDSPRTLTHLTNNRKLLERCWEIGGTYYPFGMIDLYQNDWKFHYGSYWDQVVRIKQLFDPNHLLTPGQGIFPGPDHRRHKL